MVAHSSAADPSAVDAARRAMMRRAFTLVTPVAVVLAVASYRVLSVFGVQYAREGSLTLVLLALSAVPNVVTASTVNAARVRQRMGVLFGVPATVAVLVIAASWLFMPYLGIAARRRRMAGGADRRRGRDPRRDRAVAAAAALDPGRRDALGRSAAPRAPARRHARRTTGGCSGKRLSGGSDSVVVGFGPVGPDEDGATGALLKASDSPQGQAQLRRQTEVLRLLRDDDRLTEWHRVLPRIVGEGDVSGSYCVLESRLPGSGGAGRAARSATATGLPVQRHRDDLRDAPVHGAAGAGRRGRAAPVGARADRRRAGRAAAGAARCGEGARQRARRAGARRARRHRVERTATTPRTTSSPTTTAGWWPSSTGATAGRTGSPCSTS